MKRLALLSAVLAGCLLVSAWGQSSPGAPQSAAGEQTIEQLYLNNGAMRMLHEEATSLDRDSKLLALANIRDLIDQGKLTASSAVAYDLLGMLAFEGTTRQVTQGIGQVVNNYPEVRREACNLLGRLGSPEADKLLLQVVREDSDPMVLAEAVYALGKIGTNPGEVVSQTIATALIRTDAIAPDNNFAFACMLAFEKLAAKNKGLTDQVAFQAILRISQGAYIAPVKQKAAQVLDELKSYG